MPFSPSLADQTSWYRADAAIGHLSPNEIISFPVPNSSKMWFQGQTKIIKNCQFWLSESTFEAGIGTSMAGNAMGLILSSNGPNLPFEILVSCRPVLFPASTLYPSTSRDLPRKPTQCPSYTAIVCQSALSATPGSMGPSVGSIHSPDFFI